MFSKRRLSAACLLVLMTAFVAWAASWQIQTKLATAGGTLQVEGKALQSTAGSVVYNVMADALADADVTVTAKAGYEIASITKNGVAVSGVAGLPTYTTNFTKAATAQGLIASFRGKQVTVTSSAVGPGTVTPATATGVAGSSVKITATPSNTATAITAITVNGAAYTGIALPATGIQSFTLTNITAATDVIVTFATATANAGGDKVVVYNAPVTLDGTVAGPGAIAWTQTSGPVVVLANADTATPSFTPAVTGTYGFKVAKMNGTTVLASSSTTVTAVTDVESYMESTCNGCHSQNGLNPSNSFAQWKASQHATGGVTCITCHTNGTMPSPVNQTTVDANNFTVLTAAAGTVGTVYCAQCHASSNPVHATEVVAMDVCSKCHDPHYFNENGVHHFAGLPSTGGYVDGTQRTQYVSQGATCADCHNLASNNINKGYGESGHGHVSDVAMNAFTHYDWSARTNNGTRQNGNCDRCHTTGGFAKLLGDTDAATKFAPQAGVQNVMGCQSCHTSNYATGELRTGAVPAGLAAPLSDGYFALFSSAATAVPAGKTKIQVEFPGMKNSSICIPCHSGRSTDDVFVAVIDRAKLDLKNYTTINTNYYQHAANMGQTFLGKGAFNFNGGEYVGANGHAAVANGAADTQGPCVGCHYSKAGETHSLEPVGYAASCQTCHAAPFGATDVEEKKAEFDAGVAVLDALIRTKFDPLRTVQTSPLETERANVRFGRFGKAAGVAATDATAKAAYGAWYNWQLLTAWDKAAFVHNPSFARTVLMDTIDYLDGNGASLNGSAAATIAASTAVTAEQAAAAVEFLETPACGSCHSAQTTLVQAGKHAAEVSTHSGTCGRCHTTEGYVAFLAAGNNPAGNYTKTDLAGNPAVTLGTDYAFNGSQNVSCSACHDSHGTARTANWTPSYDTTAGAPAAGEQFKLCTSCHNLVNAAGAPMASGLTVADVTTVAKQQHYKDWYRNIASTHYDFDTTGYGKPLGTTIEGYNVRFNKESACTDCHGHELYTNTGKALEPASATDADKGKGTIHTDWASSGHAGNLLTNKFQVYTTANPTRTRTNTNAAAVMAAGVTGTSGPAWEHYDWDGTSRQSCQKCHTATGAANYLNAVKEFNAGTTATVVYSAANNDFSHLKGWALAPAAAKASGQNEVLYCWGCHTNVEQGAVVQTGAMPADYKFEGGAANGTFPNVASSNLCVSCHGGRTGGMNVKARTDLVSGAVVSFTNSHYLAAGGTLFKAVGYEYTDANRPYANSSSFAHDKLGTAAKPGTGTSGPCVACHMGNKDKVATLKFDHKFKLGGLQGGTCGTTAGGIAGACHATMDQAELEEEKEHYELALDALNALLKDKGFAWGPASPYFANADWTKGGTVDGKHMLGAAFNLNYLLHEPGAYAHNRYYTKRLIIDSIDFVYNGVLETLTPYQRAGSTTWYYSGSDADVAIDYAVGKTYTGHDGAVHTFTAEDAALVKTYLDADSVTAGFSRR